MARHRRDDGFSVAEVVIAAAVMFFVLTGVVGLMGASSQMSVQAKQKSVLVNAVASEIDSIRAMPFDAIQTGSVEREMNGVAIVIDMTVETKQSLGTAVYKRVIIDAAGTMQGKTLTYRTTAAIRNPENNMTLTTDPDAPQIEFASEAPAADEVLFGSERLAGGAINLRTRAYSPAGGLSEVRYGVENQVLVQSSGSPAVFAPSGNPYFASPTWNTLSSGVVDGFQTVAVTVEDDQQRTATVKRRYIIDNQPALAPGVPTGVGIDAFSIDLSWPAARDGGVGADSSAWYWASQYEYIIYREPLTGGGSPTSWPIAKSEIVHAGETPAVAIMNAGPLSGVAVVAAPGPALSRTTRPFSRFFVRVKSGRPRGIGTAYADATQMIVTRPEIICDSSAQSSVAVGNKKGGYPFSVTLNVTKPNFPYTGTPSYVVQSKDLSVATSSWTNMITSQPGTNNSGYVTLTGSKGLSFKRHAFRVLVTGVTPSGYLPGVALPTITTNAGVMPVAPTSDSVNILTSDWGL